MKDYIIIPKMGFDLSISITKGKIKEEIKK